MKKQIFERTIILFWCSLVISNLSYSGLKKDLRQSFHLSGTCDSKTEYFIMETSILGFRNDGTKVFTDILRLSLKCQPNPKQNNDQITYTCVQFETKQGDDDFESIPDLENWTYTITEGINEKGQVFGIDHSQFENLKTSQNEPLSQGQSYWVYNTFIDFHAICNVFATKTEDGKGIQDLSRIGQTIVHMAANSKGPVHLSSHISEGSYFQNGEITLKFKGVSVVKDHTCALIGYDSGESSFQMIMNPMPDMEIRTVGRSHYMGDIYMDIESGWVQKADLIEFVISETVFPMSPNKTNSIIERQIFIRNVDESLCYVKLPVNEK